VESVENVVMRIRKEMREKQEQQFEWQLLPVPMPPRKVRKQLQQPEFRRVIVKELDTKYVCQIITNPRPAKADESDGLSQVAITRIRKSKSMTRIVMNGVSSPRGIADPSPRWVSSSTISVSWSASFRLCFVSLHPDRATKCRVLATGISPIPKNLSTVHPKC
jgi:hypothetical protein